MQVRISREELIKSMPADCYFYSAACKLKLDKASLDRRLKKLDGVEHDVIGTSNRFKVSFEVRAGLLRQTKPKVKREKRNAPQTLEERLAVKREELEMRLFDRFMAIR
jgi:hypothetical protein